MTWVIKRINKLSSDSQFNYQLVYRDTEVNTYNQLGDILFSTRWDEHNEVVRNTDYYYNRKGNLIQKNSFLSKYGFRHNTYEYYIDGSVYRSNFFVNGELINSTKYDYDIWNLCCRTDKYNAKGDLLGSCLYDNGEGELLTYCKRVNASGEKIDEDFLFYNDSKKLTKRVNFSHTKGNASSYEKNIYYLDEDEKKTKVEFCGDDEKVIRSWMYEYEYDRFGNWVSKKIFEKGLVICRQERMIEYF